MHWYLSHRFDTKALPIVDRHYNRQKIGSPQFVPPGRCLVLATLNYDALWVTSYPFEEYTKHAWAGALVCSCFRNEGKVLSSELIREALAITASKWGYPEKGMVTFVNPGKVRKKRDFGRCFLRAGFRNVGETKGGLVALQILTPDMPKPALVMERHGQELFF